MYVYWWHALDLRAVKIGHGEDPRESVAHHHRTADMVEADLRKEGFSVIDRKDVFIHPPGDEVWWLIVASKSL